MEKKLFRSYMLLITFAVLLVLVITKIDLLAGGLGVILRLLKPFYRLCHCLCTQYPLRGNSPRSAQIRASERHTSFS